MMYDLQKHWVVNCCVENSLAVLPMRIQHYLSMNPRRTKKTYSPTNTEINNGDIYPTAMTNWHSYRRSDIRNTAFECLGTVSRVSCHPDNLVQDGLNNLLIVRTFSFSAFNRKKSHVYKNSHPPLPWLVYTKQD